MPQIEAAVTLDVLYAPLDDALAQLDARLDAIRLHGMAAEGTHFARWRAWPRPAPCCAPKD
ncbi:hypothetical protein LP420_15780 [Massilia sp. B-10]|nr:hypothetical protein LP420_15780 [Massilia sp. B-10]